MMLQKFRFEANVTKIRSVGLRHMLPEFLQHEKTQVRWNARSWNTFFPFFWLIITACRAIVPVCCSPVKEGSWHILLPTTRGGVDITIVIAHIVDIMVAFLRMWAGSESIKWFLISKNARNIFPIMLNYCFRDFFFFYYYFLFSLFLS